MPSCSCESTAPSPIPEASVSRTNDLEKSGKASTGACVSICFNWSNVSWHVEVYLNKASFFIRAYNGAATCEKRGIKRL